MAATHTSGVLQASISCGVGTIPNTITSTTLDNATAYGAIITAKITNAAAPLAACVATMNVSPDGTTWYFYASQTAGLVASTGYPMVFQVPPEAIKAQITFGGNTSNAVTVEAQYQMLTAI
jgi:hypothetical protein